MTEKIIIEKCGCEKLIQENGPESITLVKLCEQANQEVIRTYNEQQYDNKIREAREIS